MSLSILDAPLLSVRHPGGQRQQINLPQVLSALGHGTNIEFTALRNHQQHGWYAFLVQLGALAAHRGSALDQPDDAWKKALLDIAGENENAWQLVVEDLQQPAFFQTPVPEDSLKRYGKNTTNPDGIDVLITSKNFDVKQGLIQHPRPEHWVYALVTLQTMEGFLGRGNYGVARMNGGFASRPALAMAPSLGWGQRFLRDVEIWLEQRPDLSGQHFDYSDNGTALLWTLPWDGKTSRPMSVCDPFFIEVCRRIRLVDSQGAIELVMAPTDKAFLDTGERRGDTGDVWTPVSDDKKGPTALTVSGSGFSYQQMTRILFEGDYVRKPALELRDEDGDEPIVVAQVLVRGQGKTDGFHQRFIQVPGDVPLLAKQAELAELAKARVERAADARRKVLHPALCVLLQGAPDNLNLRDDKSRPWLDRLDKNIDTIFFERLWRDANLDREEADKRWDVELKKLAVAQLEDALTSAPLGSATRDRAIARAEITFRGLVRKHLSNAIDIPIKEEPMESIHL